MIFLIFLTVTGCWPFYQPSLCINRSHNCVRGAYPWFTHFNTFQELPFPSFHRNTQSYPSFAETHCLWLVFSDYKIWIFHEKPIRLKVKGRHKHRKYFYAYVLYKGVWGGGGPCPKLPKWFLNSIFEALKICFILAKVTFGVLKVLKWKGHRLSPKKDYGFFASPNDSSIWMHCTPLQFFKHNSIYRVLHWISFDTTKRNSTIYIKTIDPNRPDRSYPPLPLFSVSHDRIEPLLSTPTHTHGNTLLQDRHNRHNIL